MDVVVVGGIKTEELDGYDSLDGFSRTQRGHPRRLCDDAQEDIAVDGDETQGPEDRPRRQGTVVFKQLIRSPGELYHAFGRPSITTAGPCRRNRGEGAVCYGLAGRGTVAEDEGG